MSRDITDLYYERVMAELRRQPFTLQENDTLKGMLWFVYVYTFCENPTQPKITQK